MDVEYSQLRQEHEGQTLVPIDWVLNGGFGLKELGLISYILSLPDGYILKKSELQDKTKNGSFATASCFKKLEKKGVIKTEIIRGTGTFKRYKYSIVYNGRVLREFYTNNEEYKKDKSDAYIYLYTHEHTTNTKIGVTTNPKSRLSSLNSSVGCQGNMIFVGRAYKETEAILHLKYKHKQVFGEWFDLSLDERLQIINYLKNEIH